MIRNRDTQWWVLEARKHPESAEQIIEELARRLAELDEKNEQLQDKLIHVQRRVPAAVESGETSRLRQQITSLQQQVQDASVAAPSIVVLTDSLGAERMALPQMREIVCQTQPLPPLQVNPPPRRLIYAQQGVQLILLTSIGRALRLTASDVPYLEIPGPAMWTSPGLPNLQDHERLFSTTTLVGSPRFCTVVTKKGFAQQLIHTEFNRRIDQGTALVESPVARDLPVAIVDGDLGDLLVVTRWGAAVRFPHRSIAAGGSIAIEINEDDEVVGALTLSADTDLLIVTASGYVARRPGARISPRTSPGGKGRPLIQAYDVLAVFSDKPKAELLFLTYSGRLLLIATDAVPQHERVGKGTQVHDFTHDPALSVVLLSHLD